VNTKTESKKQNTAKKFKHLLHLTLKLYMDLVEKKDNFKQIYSKNSRILAIRTLQKSFL